MRTDEAGARRRRLKTATPNRLYPPLSTLTRHRVTPRITPSASASSASSPPPSPAATFASVSTALFAAAPAAAAAVGGRPAQAPRAPGHERVTRAHETHRAPNRNRGDA